MARLTVDQWESARAKRETGASFSDLAREFGVSYQAIQKRAKAEDWSDGKDIEADIRRKVVEKVVGVVVGCNPKKKAEEIDAEAERRAAVITRHRIEWIVSTEVLDKAIATSKAAAKFGEKKIAFEDLKAAKIAAEARRIIQDGERKAWGLDVVVDVSKLTDAQLEAIAKGRMPT